jgi:hypothetical protein
MKLSDKLALSHDLTSATGSDSESDIGATEIHLEALQSDIIEGTRAFIDIYADPSTTLLQIDEIRDKLVQQIDALHEGDPSTAEAFMGQTLPKSVAEHFGMFRGVQEDGEPKPDVRAGRRALTVLLTGSEEQRPPTASAQESGQSNGEAPSTSSYHARIAKQERLNAARAAAEAESYKPRNTKEKRVFKAMETDPALVTKLLHLKRVSRPDLIDGKNTESLTRIKQKAIQAHIRAQEAGGKKYKYGDTKHTRALFEGIDLSENTLRLMNEANQVRIRRAEQVAAQRHRERIYGVNQEAVETVKNRLQTDEKFTVNLPLARERYAEELKASKHPDKINRDALRKRVAKHYVAGVSPINEYDKDLERALIAGFKLRKHEVQSLIESAVETRNNKVALNNSRGNFAELEAEGTGGNRRDKEAWEREYRSAKNRMLAGLNEEEKAKFLAEEERKFRYDVLMWAEVNFARIRAIGVREESLQYQLTAANYQLAVDQYLETDPDLDPTKSSYEDFTKVWANSENEERRHLRYTERIIREHLLNVFMEDALSDEFDAEETREVTIGKQVLTYDKSGATKWYTKLLDLHTADMSEAEREVFLLEQDKKAEAFKPKRSEPEDAPVDLKAESQPTEEQVLPEAVKSAVARLTAAEQVVAQLMKRKAKTDDESYKVATAELKAALAAFGGDKDAQSQLKSGSDERINKLILAPDQNAERIKQRKKWLVRLGVGAVALLALSNVDLSRSNNDRVPPLRDRIIPTSTTLAPQGPTSTLPAPTNPGTAVPGSEGLPASPLEIPASEVVKYAAAGDGPTQVIERITEQNMINGLTAEDYYNLYKTYASQIEQANPGAFYRMANGDLGIKNADVPINIPAEVVRALRELAALKS